MECIFNIIRNIVMNAVKNGSHVFKVVKIDVISTSGRSPQPTKLTINNLFKIDDILNFTNLQRTVANKNCKKVYTTRIVTRY